MPAKPGLYANIWAKRERIAQGSSEKMRRPGTKGAPTEKAFVESAKTAKPQKEKTMKAAVKKAKGGMAKMASMDKAGRALKKSTADSKGRAMKSGLTGYGGVMAMKKGGSAKKGK
jgi:hypothetical protein